MAEAIPYGAAHPASPLKRPGPLHERPAVRAHRACMRHRLWDGHARARHAAERERIGGGGRGRRDCAGGRARAVRPAHHAPAPLDGPSAPACHACSAASTAPAPPAGPPANTPQRARLRRCGSAMRASSTARATTLMRWPPASAAWWRGQTRQTRQARGCHPDCGLHLVCHDSLVQGMQSLPMPAAPSEHMHREEMLGTAEPAVPAPGAHRGLRKWRGRPEAAEADREAGQQRGRAAEGGRAQR